MKQILLMLVISLFIVSCDSDDSSTNPQPTKVNALTATISGDETYDYKANIVNFFDIGETWHVSGNMLNSEQQEMQLKVYFNNEDGKMQYDLAGSDDFTQLSIRARNGSPVNVYMFAISGSLTFTKKVKDTVEGTFNFSASTVDTLVGGARTIQVQNGSFYYAR